MINCCPNILQSKNGLKKKQSVILNSYNNTDALDLASHEHRHTDACQFSMVFSKFIFSEILLSNSQILEYS